MIVQRQKLIKQADMSEHGWLVIAEYEKDELADDEHDKKRIMKAVKNVKKKAEAAALK